jgi:hypothetical protein
VKKQIITAIVFSILSVSCNSIQPSTEPEGKGVEVENLAGIDGGNGTKVDGSFIRDRNLVGIWKSNPIENNITYEISIGIDKNISLRIMKERSIISIASGEWQWTDDGKLSGTMRSVSGSLIAFSSWKAAFPESNTMSFVGSDGTKILFLRPARSGMKRNLRP